MSRSEKIHAEEFINRFTLIVGEINSGKTALTRNILEILCRAVDGKVTVVDLAPEITPRDLTGKFAKMAVGGGLRVPKSKAVRYYRGSIYPPRLRARDEKEAAALAAENRRNIDAIFAKALTQVPDVLCINDCSLYLHAGSAAKLLDWIRSSPTSLVNGYWGRSFSNYSISIRERKAMEVLMRHCDRLIRLS